MEPYSAIVSFVIGFLLARGPAVYHWAMHTEERMRDKDTTIMAQGRVIQIQENEITALKDKLSPEVMS